MNFLNTPHKKKSAIITFFSGLTFFLIFFLFGLNYLDPPITYGMEVSFGVSDRGGFAQEQEINQSIKEEEKSEGTNANEPQLSNSKNVVVQKESNISVDNKVDKEETTSSNKDKKVIDEQNQEIDDNTKSILSNLVNQNDQKAKINSLKGDDNTNDIKGQNSGNPYTNTYINIEGFKDLNNRYGLNGRSLKSNGSVVQECNEEGIVVVRITVNPKGKVVDAKPGVRGSSNIHPCLLKPAIETAFLHEWYPDTKAPSKQIGFVVVNFKIRK